MSFFTVVAAYHGINRKKVIPPPCLPEPDAWLSALVKQQVGSALSSQRNVEITIPIQIVGTNLQANTHRPGIVNRVAIKTATRFIPFVIVDN